MILSLMLGRSAGLSPDELRLLGEGALFHDIGKVRVPDAVLRNPQRKAGSLMVIGALSEEQIDQLYAYLSTLD